jgi:hypothetical protein
VRGPEPLPDRYDLIICINGVGRLREGTQSPLLRSLTAATDALLFIMPPTRWRAERARSIGWSASLAMVLRPA